MPRQHSRRRAGRSARPTRLFLEVTTLGEVLSTRGVGHCVSVASSRMCCSRSAGLGSERVARARIQSLSRAQRERVSDRRCCAGIALGDLPSHRIELPAEADSRRPLNDDGDSHRGE